MEDYRDLPKSRKEAKEIGSPKYYTGKPCKNGHLSSRYTNEAKCTTCVAMRSSKYREDNREEVLKSKRDWHHKNRDAILSKKKKYYEENKEWLLESQKEYAKNNEDIIKERRKKYRERNRDKLLAGHKEYRENNREKVSEAKKRWYLENRDYVREYHRNRREEIYRVGGDLLEQYRLSKRIEASNRRAKKAERTLEFTDDYLSELNEMCVREIYQQAQDLESTLGEEYHVDHVVPLNGDNVSGLHVWYNLQVLEGRENESKSNKFEEFLEVY